MRSYTQLTQEQRYQIYALKKAGLSQTKTAVIIGVDKATICRESPRVLWRLQTLREWSYEQIKDKPIFP